MSEFSHFSVLLSECIENLNIKPDGVYVDGTAGGAGHSSKIAEKLSPDGLLVPIDQDEDAIAVITERLAQYSDRIKIVRDNFSNIKNVLLPLLFTRLALRVPASIILFILVSSADVITCDLTFNAS